MKLLKSIGLIAITGLLFTNCGDNVKSKTAVNAATIPISGTIKAELTAPPFVPAPVGDRPAKKLLLEMEILEKEGEMADGVKYVYWTF